MKKTKIARRIENGFDAFFADEISGENNLENSKNQSNLRQENKSENSARQISPLETILRQVFLFFPGTFVLYILSTGFTAMFINAFTKLPRMTLRYDFIFFAGLFISATLMTWLGLGDVRKPKHFVIPVSIISVGVFSGAIAGVLMSASTYFTRLFIDNGLPFYLLPLALIVPFLAKGWVDRKSEIALD